VDSTRTPWTTGGLHRDSTRISGEVINTGLFWDLDLLIDGSGWLGMGEWMLAYH